VRCLDVCFSSVLPMPVWSKYSTMPVPVWSNYGRDVVCR